LLCYEAVYVRLNVVWAEHRVYSSLGC